MSEHEERCDPVPPVEPQKPAPGPSYYYRVDTFSNYPVYTGKWDINLYNEAQFHVYQNAANDAIGLVMMRLGQIFAKYDVTGDLPETQNLVKRLIKVLKDEGDSVLD